MKKFNNLPNDEDIELSSITLAGQFSQNDILNWISTCLPNVPKFQDQEETTLYYKSTFIGTYLMISLGNGNCELSSNNLSALIILKKSIITEANAKGKR